MLVISLQQPIDATVLNFTLEEKVITVQLGRWKLQSDKAAERNSFVDQHIKAINPEKYLFTEMEKQIIKVFNPSLKC